MALVFRIAKIEIIITSQRIIPGAIHIVKTIIKLDYVPGMALAPAPTMAIVGWNLNQLHQILEATGIARTYSIVQYHRTIGTLIQRIVLIIELIHYQIMNIQLFFIRRT